MDEENNSQEDTIPSQHQSTPTAMRTTISSGSGSGETLDPKRLSIEQMHLIRNARLRVEVRLNKRGTSLLTIDGVCQSIDPLTRSVILLHADGDPHDPGLSTMSGLTVLPGDLIQTIQVIDDPEGQVNSQNVEGKVQRTIADLRGCSSQSWQGMGKSELLNKKNQIKDWLEKNRIPVRESQVVESGFESTTSTSVSFEMLPTLFIAGSCTLQAPYTCDNLLCPNEIMFAKLKHLIQSMH